MKVIYKYELGNRTKLELPIDSQILKFEEQVSGSARNLCIWVLQDNSTKEVFRTFQIFGTGFQIPNNSKWIGTCQVQGGFVWHLFEIMYDI